MKDRKLSVGVKGWGRSVHAIQHMPSPRLRNTELTMQAIVRDGARQAAE